MTFALSAGLSTLGIVRIARERLTGPWPWRSIALFGVLLLVGQLQPLARPDRMIGLATLASTLIIGRWWRDTGQLRWLSIALSMSVVANAIWVRGRPFWIDNPNIVAGWLLLLPQEHHQ